MSNITPAPEAVDRLRRAVQALGRDTKERAMILGVTVKRAQQYERGLLPGVIFRFEAAGIITINEPTVNEPAPAEE